MTSHDSAPRRDIDLAMQAHRNLIESLDANPIDVSAPSRLPGWTKGHVLTHIVNSGDGHVGIFDGAALGETRAQYPHGVDGRAADIEVGAPRPIDEQSEALRSACAALEQRWAESAWTGSGITPRGGPVPLTDLPFLRLREIAIHHVDLDIGYEFTDLPAPYVALELDRMASMWMSRHDGSTALPSGALDLDPPDRLAWLVGRIVIDGLAPADVF